MKNWSLLWIPLLSIVVQNDWYLVVVYEWFLGIITDSMQFINRILLVWFVFIDSRSIERIWIECAEIAYHEDWLIHDGQKRRKEKRTLDSNPFNDVYSIFMLSVIMIIRIEWERIKMGWDWDWLWFGINSISVIHSWKWLSMLQKWFRSGCGLWLSLECYT